jgi:membrane-associated phospholipid phosphatase
MKTETSAKLRIWLFWIVLATVFILSLVFDRDINAAIQSIRNPVMDSFFSFFLFLEKNLIFYPLVIIIPACILLWKRKKFILPLIISAAVSALIAFALKYFFARPRPLGTEFDSFPSGHATQAFMPIPFLRKSKLITIIWLIFACLLAFTRVWFNLHYLSDVIAGAVIGYFVSVAVMRIYSNRFLKSKK